MADMEVCFDIRLTPRVFPGLAAAIILIVSARELATESVTMTTYYPAPSGVYNQLMTTKNAYLARDSGQVGIGTTNPTAQLDVAGGIRFAGGLGDLSQLNGNPSIGSNGAYPLLMAVNGVEQARISAGGNLGIGTTNPATKLEVNGNLSFTSPGAGYAKICQDVVYGNTAYTACPANSTPVMTAVAMTQCNEGSRGLKPCAFPETGTMRCCKLGP